MRLALTVVHLSLKRRRSRIALDSPPDSASYRNLHLHDETPAACELMYGHEDMLVAFVMLVATSAARTWNKRTAAPAHPAAGARQ
ncbi:hypothetical protein ACCO45_000490 [Purpureocillium lilacinum]|uniref:Uncharacterized protein n=1 Tax=Purpureocillium lilacinum TaxID=33203 RepID=A0ACC4E4V8_PURLI